MSWLDFENVSVHYGKVAGLLDVSFEVAEGEMVGIIGRNGAGKTTILRALAGLCRPSQGSITFKTKRIDNLPAHEIVNQGIVYVPEGRRVFSELTVQENLKLGAFIHYRQKRKAAAAANLNRLLDQFSSLGPRKDQLAGTLSGGEQQLLAIARALMSDPSFLLLDEPSMGLAPLMVSKVFETIKELHRTGVTILLVEQKAYLTLKMVDRAYVLANGRITLSGTGEQLFNDESVKTAYLGQKAESR